MRKKFPISYFQYCKFENDIPPRIRSPSLLPTATDTPATHHHRQNSSLSVKDIHAIPSNSPIHNEPQVSAATHSDQRIDNQAKERDFEEPISPTPRGSLGRSRHTDHVIPQSLTLLRSKKSLKSSRSHTSTLTSASKVKNLKFISRFS